MYLRVIQKPFILPKKIKLVFLKRLLKYNK
jgi:hypothetical protein